MLLSSPQQSQNMNDLSGVVSNVADRFIPSFNFLDKPPIAVGERVVYLGTGDIPEHGTVKWIGHLNEIGDGWSAGVELDNPVGNIDGVWGNRQLFICQPKHGLIIEVNGLIKQSDFYGTIETANEVSSSLSKSPEMKSNATPPSPRCDASKDSKASSSKNEDASSTNVDQTTSGVDSKHETVRDDEIEKFLASRSSPMLYGGSFDRRVYARMFADCEVEKWYEILDIDKVQADAELAAAAGCVYQASVQDGAKGTVKKKGRGGIFRFIRWLRRKRSSSGASSVDKRVKRSASNNGGRRRASSSLESLTSLSQSFHYIPVSMYFKEAYDAGREQIYEDIDSSVAVSKLKSSSMSGAYVAPRQAYSIEIAADREKLQLKKSCSVNQLQCRKVASTTSGLQSTSSSARLRRKKCRAPLPPSAFEPKPPPPSSSPFSPRAKQPFGQNKASTIDCYYLRNGSHRMVASTGAIYERKQQQLVGASGNEQRSSDEPRQNVVKRNLSSVNLTSECKQFRVGAYVKKKGKAPPPPRLPLSSSVEVSEAGGCRQVEVQSEEVQIEEHNLESTDTLFENKASRNVLELPPSNGDETPGDDGHHDTGNDSEEFSLRADGDVTGEKRRDQIVKCGSQQHISSPESEVNDLSDVEEKKPSHGIKVEAHRSDNASFVDLASTLDKVDIQNITEIKDASEEFAINSVEAECEMISGSCKSLIAKQGTGSQNKQAQVNIHELQELVESLVVQYCSARIDGHLEDKREGDREVCAIPGKKSFEDSGGRLCVTEIKLASKSASHRQHGGQIDLCSLSEDFSRPVISNVSFDGTSSGFLEEKLKKVALKRKNRAEKHLAATGSVDLDVTADQSMLEVSLSPSTSTSQDDFEESELVDRLLERWQTRMNRQFFHMDWNVHEKKHSMSENMLYAMSSFNSCSCVSKAVLEEDTRNGIYEPINIFGQKEDTDSEVESCSSRPPATSERLRNGKVDESVAAADDCSSRCLQQDPPDLLNVVTKNENDVPATVNVDSSLIRRLSVNGEQHNIERSDMCPDGVVKMDCRPRPPSHFDNGLVDYRSPKRLHYFAPLPVYENICAFNDGAVGMWRDRNSFSALTPYWDPTSAPMIYRPLTQYSQLRGLSSVPLVPQPFVPSQFTSSSSRGFVHPSPPSPHYGCQCFQCVHRNSKLVGCSGGGASSVNSNVDQSSRQLAGVKRTSISPAALSKNPFLQEGYAAVCQKTQSPQRQAASPQPPRQSPVACKNTSPVVARSKVCDDEEGKRTYANVPAVSREPLMEEHETTTKKKSCGSGRRRSDSGVVPPVPPPRLGSVSRSLRLAANCDWLKEKSKSVEAKIKLAKDNDVVVYLSSADARDFSTDGRSRDSRKAFGSVSCKTGQTSNDAELGKSSMSSNSDEVQAADGLLALPCLSVMDNSTIIGGVKVPTPFNLWPLEYELVAPELSRLKAKLAGLPLPELGYTGSKDHSDNMLLIKKLLKQLELCISTGELDKASALARNLAQLKIQCSVTENKTPSSSSGEQIIVNMFVEDKVSHHGPIPIRLKKSITVGELKKKIFREFEFPTELQRWILGKKLVTDDEERLSSFGIEVDGCPVFLYLLTPDVVPVKMENLICGAKVEKPNQTPRKAKGANKENDVVVILEQLQNKVDVCEENIVTEASNDNNNVTLAAGWHCLVCTLVNVPTRPGCEACGACRPDDYVIPESYQLRDNELEWLQRERQADQELEFAFRQAEEEEQQRRGKNYAQLVQLEDQDLITNVEEFECSICMADVEVNDGVKLRDCLHMFCRDCLSNAVAYTEEAAVVCPYRDDDYSCKSVLQEREIRALVPPEAYEKHLQRSMATAESQARNSFHCKTVDCTGWCLFDDDVNEFLCPVCHHKNCLTCQAIHEEMNCRQYQDRVYFTANADANAKKTKEALDQMLALGEAMHCPSCNIIIMKKTGCDWICCTICKTEICWVTKGPRWGPKGRGDTTGGCRCGLNGRRCNPRCNFCH